MASRNIDHETPRTYTAGIYPFVQTGDIRKADGLLTEYTQTYSEDGLKQSKLWPKGTLCITIAANIAETAILGFEGCFPDSVVGFIPNDPFDVRYFNYFMQTAREDLERYAPATAQKNINLKILSEVAVPIPPLPEQRRIVARIEELFSRLDAGVAALRHAKAQLQRYRQSVLAAAVTGQLTQAWREQHLDTEPAKEFLKRILKKRREQWDGRGKYKEPIEPATERGGEIPDGWVRTSTDSVCSQITDGEHIQPPYQDEGLPMLSAKHVRDGYVILNGAGLIAPDDFETCLKRCAPVKNDVLICKRGSNHWKNRNCRRSATVCPCAECIAPTSTLNSSTIPHDLESEPVVYGLEDESFRGVSSTSLVYQRYQTNAVCPSTPGRTTPNRRRSRSPHNRHQPPRSRTRPPDHPLQPPQAIYSRVSVFWHAGVNKDNHIMHIQPETLIREFTRELRNKNAGIFAGAGLSMPSGYVDWKTLLRNVIQDLGLDPDLESDLVTVAQYYCNRAGGNRAQLSQTIFDHFSQTRQPTPNHEILARLPIQTYWTTNYDKPIEQ